MALLVYPRMLSPHLARFSAVWFSFSTAESVVRAMGLWQGKSQPLLSGCQSQIKIKKGSVGFRKLHGDQQDNELLQ